MSRGVGVARFAVGIALAAALGLSGCAGGAGDAGASASASGEDAGSSGRVPDVIAGELSGHDGRLTVGDDITVMVNLPDDAWTVTSTDTAVVALSTEKPSDEVSLVRLEAKAPGESTVTFTGPDDVRDELTIVVKKP